MEPFNGNFKKETRSHNETKELIIEFIKDVIDSLVCMVKKIDKLLEIIE